MKKESSHRSHELKDLGWNQEEIIRYEELFEYSQRWGLINLEREDRQFLRKAEKLLPKIKLKKNSIKKSIEEKSYYQWLMFYFEKINEFDQENLSKNFKSVWIILIEEELKLLKELKPVLGLPDTVKARELYQVRNELIDIAINNFKAEKNDKSFQFNSVFNSLDKEIPKSWKSLVDSDSDKNKGYLIVEFKEVEEFRIDVHKKIGIFMRDKFPSLKENI